MELQDYNIFEQRLSTYRTNHIHMRLDGFFDFDFNKMELKDFASLVHEYVHYLQHFHTLYGLNLVAGYNTIFAEYKAYFEQHQEIHIPLHLPLHDNMEIFRSNYKRVYGDEECNDYNIDAVEVNIKEITKAENDKKGVMIGVYDFENEQADEMGFEFGYCCVIEGMAHLVQSLIRKDIHHQEIKYNAVQLICNNYCSTEIAKNTKLIISACVCALMYTNPGVQLFRVLDFITESGITDGRVLYQDFVNSHSIRYKGEVHSIKSAMSDFLKRVIISLELATGCDLVYYKRVMENCQLYINEQHNPIIDMIYEFDLSKRDFLHTLIDSCGIPTIEDNQTLYPPLNKEGLPYIESAALLGKELIIKRFESQKTECPRYKDVCKKKEYSNNDPITAECQYDQWNRQGTPCLMSAAFHYYRLEGHTIIQDS